MPWGWFGDVGRHFDDASVTRPGRPRRDRRAVKNARRARRHNRRH